MEELEKVPIYRVNDYGKGIEFLENYLKTKNIDTDTLNIEFYVKNELLYFVPFPLFPTNKTNERRYVLFVAHKDEYKPFLDDIVFSEDILKKLVNSQILSQTNEYGHFNAYKVVDKENFIHQYVNKINATKIKKDTDIYLLKLHASDYSIVLKQYKYERLPFETLKLSDIEKKPEYKSFKETFLTILKNRKMNYLMIISMMKVLVTTSCCTLLPFLWKDMGYTPFYIGTALFLFIIFLT